MGKRVKIDIKSTHIEYLVKLINTFRYPGFINDCFGPTISQHGLSVRDFIKLLDITGCVDYFNSRVYSHTYYKTRGWNLCDPIFYENVYISLIKGESSPKNLIPIYEIKLEDIYDIKSKTNYVTITMPETKKLCY